MSSIISDILEKMKLLNIQELEKIKLRINETISNISSKSEEEELEVSVFIDDSNLWVESQRAYSKKKGLTEILDARARLNLHELLKLVDGTIITKKIYTSKKMNDNNNFKYFESSGFDSNVFYRTCSNGEKCVDSSMACDIVETAITKTPGKIVVFCGDLDFLPAIEKALNNGWKVELFFYEDSISNGYKKLTNEESEYYNENFTINYLDNHINKFVYNNYQWKNTVPYRNSIILSGFDSSMSENDIYDCILQSFLSFKTNNDIINSNIKNLLISSKPEYGINRQLQYHSTKSYFKWVNKSTVIVVFNSVKNNKELKTLIYILSNFCDNFPLVMSFIDFADKKPELLKNVKHDYTYIKNIPDHNDWIVVQKKNKKKN